MTDETRAKVREALKAAKDAQGLVQQELAAANMDGLRGTCILLSRQEGALEAAVAILEMV